jgi:hypothetical protein
MKRRYPRGKLRPDDLGELTMRLAIQDHTLLIIFPYPVDWIGVGGVAEVEAFIGMLQEKLSELKAAAQ